MAPGNFWVDTAQKPYELLMPVPRMAITDDLTLEQFERGDRVVVPLRLSLRGHHRAQHHCAFDQLRKLQKERRALEKELAKQEERERRKLRGDIPASGSQEQIGFVSHAQASALPDSEPAAAA